MLSRQHFYHRITRKLVVAFGTLFNNLQLYRYNKEGTVEIERIVVPLSYASKEKFYTRITQDPTLNKEVQMTLPRMSFEMTSIAYDPLRKTSSFNTLYSSSNGISNVKQIPYNFTFNLSIFVRNTEDGTQLIEQILPYFSPDYTFTVDLTGLGLKVDIPIILDSIQYNDQYDGNADQLRVLTWDLSFTAKAFLYGLIESNTSNKIIRQVTANVYNSSDSSSSDKFILMSSGSGNYQNGELVYEGRSELKSNGSGFVTSWDNTAKQLIVTRTYGNFTTGNKLVGVLSNAVYSIASSSDTNIKLANIEIRPDPITANANTAYGFDITIEEFPNIT